MRPSVRSVAQARRGSISVLELSIACLLSCLVMILVATTWRAFGRPALEVEARARIQQEGVLAAQSLACDFGGFLGDAPGRTGAITGPIGNAYQFTGWDLSQPGVLLLNFEGATSGQVVIVGYQLQGGVLERTNYSTGTTTAVARYAQAFSASPVPGSSNQVQITLTFGYSYFTSTFTLIGVAPS